MVVNFVCLLPILASNLALTSSRKYNVEMESIKLFGENIYAVLRRFRRSPEYLEILNTHLEDVVKERDQSIYKAYEMMEKDLKKRSHALFGINVTRRFFPALQERRQFRKHRRNSEPTNSTSVERAVQALDDFYSMRSMLSADERNHFKDMGFEITGEYIDKMIKNLNPHEPHTAMQSTRQPWGSDKLQNDTKTTTEHSHVVTRPSTITIYVNELNTTSSMASTTAVKTYKRNKVL